MLEHRFEVKAKPRPKSEYFMELEAQHGSLNYAPLPIVLSRGEGARLWDVDGNVYLDFLSGLAAVSQGHCHPKIIRALKAQAEKLTHVSRAFHSDMLGPFAAYACKLFGYDRILTLNTGVEAVEAAVKLARKWGYAKKGIAENQAKIIVCSDNFHGRTLTAVSCSTNPLSKKNFGPFLEGFEAVPFGDLEALQFALKDPSVAAFLVEPIQGEAGVVVPPSGYLASAKAACEQNHVLFVADEVQTGIGRTGKLLACDHENVRPDIVILGKALSGGVLPVSAILADHEIMSLFQPGDHGSTFGGNPLACQVALAALQVVVEERLTERAEMLGRVLRSELRSLGHFGVREVRGQGLLNAIVLKEEYPHTAREVCTWLIHHGVLAKDCRDKVIRLAPPLVISPEQLSFALKAIAQALG